MTATKFCSGKMNNKLYYIRTQRGLSLKDVSEQYFIRYGEKLSPKKLGQLEADKITVPVDIYLNLADLLEVTLDFMLDRTNAPDEEVRIRQKEFIDPGIQ